MMFDANETLRKYKTDGFAIIRNLIDKDLIAEADEHVRWLTKKYPDLRPEHFHHPLMRDDAFWVRLVTDERIVKLAEMVLGSDIACFTSHYICKPPHDGQPVFWHQDGAYWNLDPMEAVSVWLAVDESSAETGCLRMVPGSHVLPLDKPELRTDTPNMLCSSMRKELVNEWVERAGIVNVELQPGDASIHHPNIIHCSEPNQSSKRRCGLDIGFMRTTTRISNPNLYLDPIIVKGNPEKGVNNYRRWPEYRQGESIAFRGHQEWNTRLSNEDKDPIGKTPEETPIQITLRMIERLEAGTVKG